MYKSHKYNIACQTKNSRGAFLVLVLQGKEFVIECLLLLLWCVYIYNPESQNIIKK